MALRPWRASEAQGRWPYTRPDGRDELINRIVGKVEEDRENAARSRGRRRTSLSRRRADLDGSPARRNLIATHSRISRFRRREGRTVHRRRRRSEAPRRKAPLGTESAPTQPIDPPTKNVGDGESTRPLSVSLSPGPSPGPRRSPRIVSKGLPASKTVRGLFFYLLTN